MTNRMQHFLCEEKETTIQTEFALLCDYIDPTERGLFNAYGAGIHAFRCRKLPDSRPFKLVMSIEYDLAEDAGHHSITIRVIDPDGRNRLKPTVIDVEFESIRRFYDFDTELCPIFDKYGMHSVEVTLDGKSITSISLEISAEK